MCSSDLCFLVIIQPYLIKRIIDDGIVADNERAVIVFISFMVLAGYTRAMSIGIRRYFSMDVSYNVETVISLGFLTLSMLSTLSNVFLFNSSTGSTPGFITITLFALTPSSIARFFVN